MKGGLGGLMRQAQQMQETMKKAQAELAELEVTGESGAGMVKITMTGKFAAKRVENDPQSARRTAELSQGIPRRAFADAYQSRRAAHRPAVCAPQR